VLPYRITLDVSAAPTGTTNIPACEGVAYHAVWFKYRASSIDVILRLAADVPTVPVNYDPSVSVWRGHPDALVPYALEGQDLCGSLGGGYAFNFPVVPYTDYYFQVVSRNALPPNSPLVFNLDSGPNFDLPAGAVVIPDAAPQWPAWAIHPQYGGLYQALRIPGGEFGAIAPTGEWCVEHGYTQTQGSVAVKFYNAALQLVRDFGFSTNVVTSICCDYQQRFYVMTMYPISPAYATLWRFTLDGTLEWNLTISDPAARNLGGALFAVNRASTVLYYGDDHANNAIKRYDIATTYAALSDFLPATVGLCYRSVHPVEDDSLWVLSGGTQAGLLTSATLKHYSAAGALLGTIASPLTITHLAMLDVTPGFIWVWGYNSTLGSEKAQFRRIDLATGAVTTSFQVATHLTNGLELPAYGGWSISTSCPLMITTVPLAKVPFTPSPPAPEEPSEDCCVAGPIPTQWGG
jgi:hypothetical protein